MAFSKDRHSCRHTSGRHPRYRTLQDPGADPGKKGLATIVQVVGIAERVESLSVHGPAQCDELLFSHWSRESQILLGGIRCTFSSP